MAGDGQFVTELPGSPAVEKSTGSKSGDYEEPDQDGFLPPLGGKHVSREMTMTPTDELAAERNGTWVSCFFHIITAVIGSGVLYLPFFFAILGWVGGIIMTLTFGGITWYTSELLADAMVIDGVRYRSYQSAVEAVFGRVGGIILAIVQYPNLILTAIAYNITGANSMKYFAYSYPSFATSSICREVTPMLSNSALDGTFDCSVCLDDPTAAGCSDNCVDYCSDSKYWVFAIIFGAAQLFMSQLPNLDSAWWASMIGALMSFGYSFISFGMSIYQLAKYGAAPTSASGIPVSQVGSAQRAYDVFNAFGGIVFAFSFSFILIEISDTLTDAGRGAVWHMKRAVAVAVTVITIFYMMVSIFGYVAYGGEILYDNAYIISLWSTNTGAIPTTQATTNVARAANIMVLIHMLPAYQVFSQPVFAATERLLRHKKSNILMKLGHWAFRIGFRSLYVVVVCFIAIALPFFSDFVGLIGALGFWPATVLFPIEMYRRLHKPGWGKTIWLESLNVFCCLVTIAAVIGSVQLIVMDASSYTFF